MKLKGMLKNNLISVLDQTFPDANKFVFNALRASKTDTKSELISKLSSDTVNVSLSYLRMPLRSVTRRVYNYIAETLAAAINEIQRLSAMLPECDVGMAMHGVGDTLEPQLMAEIGDV